MQQCQRAGEGLWENPLHPGNDFEQICGSTGWVLGGKPVLCAVGGNQNPVSGGKSRKDRAGG